MGHTDAAAGLKVPAVDSRLLTEEAVERSVLYCVTNGITTATGSGFHHCPVMAAPTPFPRGQFVRARGAQPMFNELVDKVSRDFAFLEKTLRPTAAADPFTGKLFEIFEKVYLARGAEYQKLMLGMHRADYMLDTTGAAAFVDTRVKQIEINTIAAAFAGLSPLTNALHQFSAAQVSDDEVTMTIPKSESMEVFPAALAAAFRRQQRGAAAGHQAHAAVVMFVVQPGERNVDRAMLAQRLFTEHKIRSIERTLDDVAQRGSLDAHKNLTIDGMTVAVAYFRAGYTPDDYGVGAGDAWAARLRMEESTAVKCPSIPYHLAGTKKIQQVLCDAGILRRYLSAEDADHAMAFFATMSGLEDSEESLEIISAAMATPDDWLLKPQREGGGNLIFGEAMTKILAHRTEDNKSEFILMKKVRPAPVPSAVIREGKARHDEFISELGIYGAFLGDGERVHLNETAGHLLRSKPVHQEDGGVASGVAALDSVQLV